MINLYSKFYNRFRTHIWKIRRKKINTANRNKLKSKDFTIISSNCNGGVLYHDLGLKFLSPTINLFMKAEDFIRFCENLKYYMTLDLTECRDENESYPVAYLGDIKLFLVHYKSFVEAQTKWNERKKCINWNKIIILNTDRDGMNSELKNRFENLPYNKVMFTNKPDKEHNSCYYISGYENEECVGILFEMRGWKGYRPIDQFDYVSLFNKFSEI